MRNMMEYQAQRDKERRARRKALERAMREQSMYGFDEWAFQRRVEVLTKRFLRQS